MQSVSPKGQQVHPHNGPVFLPSSILRRTTDQEPGLNKTFAFRVAPKISASFVGDRSLTGFRVESKKGLLKFFIDGDTSQINFASACFLRCRNVLWLTWSLFYTPSISFFPTVQASDTIIDRTRRIICLHSGQIRMLNVYDQIGWFAKILREKFRRKLR